MTAPGWLRARRADVLLAALVAAAQVGITAVAGRQQPGSRPLDALAVALLLGSAAALLVRRDHPVAALLVAGALTWVYWLPNYPGGPVFLALLVTLVGAILAGQRVAAWTTLGVGYLASIAAGLWSRGLYVGSVLGVAAWLLVLGAAAEVVKARRERAAEAARTRAEEERRRAGERRMGIARELHDVLAHHISLINVQAGVALHLLDERPEQARTALAAIKQASRESLGELRSVLEVLRQGDEAAPRTPAPGLEALDGLVTRTSAAGVPVRVEVDGEPRPLPAAVSLAAYRIVQEALTNVARHAGPASATVRLGYAEDALVVEVEDTGRGSGRPAPGGTGSGLLGMAERAGALGGEAEAGPHPAGGFRVRARLPHAPDRHVNRAMTKLHARDRAQLVVVAYESGLVRPGWTG